MVLLSHDHHGDNLDDAGRALLPVAGVVLTTTPRGQAAGRQRLRPPTMGDHPAGGPGTPDDPGHRHPCRHGPPLSRPIVGDVIQLCHLVRPRTAIPVHYEGWTHFRQDRTAIDATCEQVLMRLVRDPGRAWLDLRGLSYLQLAIPDLN